MRDKINVLMVTAFDPDEPAGGVNTMIHTLNHQLAPHCRIVLLVYDWNAIRPTRQVVDGIVRYRLRFQIPYFRHRPLGGAVGWLTRFPSTLRSLRRILRDEAIDVVHLHYGSAYQYYFPVARRLFGTPYILTLHRGDIMTFAEQTAPDRWLLRRIMHGADRVVSVSRWLADQATAIVRDPPPMTVILNGVDFDALDALYDPGFDGIAGGPLPPRYVLMVSNVTYYKAQDVLIRAWAELRARHPGVQLLIVGEKRELWDDCVRLIAETGCGDSVRLLGSQPRRAAINLMHRATALVLPSRSEGLPYVLLEAGAIGTPVICSDIGPFVEVVEDDRTALVTPVEDHHAVARAIDRVLGDPEGARRIGQALRARIRTDFSAAVMADRYLAIYREIVAGRTRE